MKAFMFAGQGSQLKGMGGDLFDEFKEWTEKADKILGYSIKELCLDDPRRELNKTEFTQPALYVVNAFSYFKKIKETGKKPDYVIGHSLGEFNALLAAECFSFETGLKLVKKRGELMSLATGGAMAAILNASKDEIVSILEKNQLTSIDLANYNTSSQIVISGLIDDIGKAQSFFQSGEVLYYPLNTSGAFHSRYMQPAKEKFEIYLKKFKLSNPKIPVISNVTARPYQKNEVAKNLSNQIVSSVKWSDGIQYLMAINTNGDNSMEFEELGGNDVLTKLVDKIRKEPLNAIDAPSQAQENNKNSVAGFTAKQKLKGNEIAALNETPLRFASANDKVDAWNKNYKIGTRVKSSIMDYGDLETRTDAVVLFGHRAAVYMKEYNGYFDLDEVTPL